MSVKTIALDDDAVRLQELVARASEGEQIVIAQNEHPLAKLVPFADVEDDRTFGQARGRIHVNDDSSRRALVEQCRGSLATVMVPATDPT